MDIHGPIAYSYKSLRLAIDLKCDWFLDRAIFLSCTFRDTRARQDVTASLEGLDCGSIAPLFPPSLPPIGWGSPLKKGGGPAARPVGGVGPRRVEVTVTVRGTPGGTL